MLNYHVVFLGSISLEYLPFILELMLFYSHLLPVIAVPSIFMQILMAYSIHMLDEKMMLVSMISIAIIKF